MKVNVLEYEIEPRRHPIAATWGKVAVVATGLTIVGLPISLGLIAWLLPKWQEHSLWKEQRIEGDATD